MHLAHKKVVLVIVEGPSDDVALGVMLNQIFDKDAVHIHIMHGDITTKRGVRPDNILIRIGNVIREYAKSQHYKSRDFKQIIYITDTDGTFIPDETVMDDINNEEVMYESDGIHTMNKQGIINRNKQKKANLIKLKSIEQVWNIPYRIYYMSCNLDHVLYNKRNSSDEGKEENAYSFARKYKNDVDGFIDYISNSDFSTDCTYEESWNYIEEGMNSLERNTNLNICINEELESRK